MANKTVEVQTFDQDPNTKLQELKGWNNGAPVIAIIEKPARIKVQNGVKLTVDDGVIKGADLREYYYITNGNYKGKYVKKEDTK